MGMLCWTEWGTFTFTRSLRLAAARDLIKISTPLSVEALVVDILTDVPALPGVQDFAFDDSPQKLLKVHAVVAEKAGHGSRRSQHDAEPTGCLPPNHMAEKQIHACGDYDRENGAEELPGRQAEENALLVLPDFFWDFYFDKCHLNSCKNLTCVF